MSIITHATSHYDITVDREGHVYTAISTGMRLHYGDIDPVRTAKRIRTAAAVAMQKRANVRIVSNNMERIAPVVEALGVLPFEDYQRAVYYCSTTGRFYHPLSFHDSQSRAQGFRFVWAYCPYCDHGRLTTDHPDYEPLFPQPHCYTLTMDAVAEARAHAQL